MEHRSDSHNSQEDRLPSNVLAQKDHLPPRSPSGEDHGTLQQSSQQYIPIADPTPIETCHICLESWTGSEVANRFTYRCPYGCDIVYCMDCLKGWFLGACDDESKMPPRCCSVIPLGVISDSLNQSGIEKYKAKFEEWNTSKRLYCPIPTCSTFIPKKLYVELRRVANRTVSPEYPAIKTSSSSQSSDKPKAQRTIDYSKILMDPLEVGLMTPVSCPVCFTIICTKCGSLQHSGNCPNTIDPELEEQMCGGCHEAQEKPAADDDLDGQAWLHRDAIDYHDETYLGIIDAWDFDRFNVCCWYM
ncbi:hypothetical protein B7494_g1473 [Chlorociboria aeruginascens]|nr:hypothetical protein B7494_g1473 [Chlorociboria aeruginascens]